MDTTTAAIQAGVTAATIRTWCRRNVIAAVKHAGRWIIDATSLAHRIQIGARRMTQRPTLSPAILKGIARARYEYTPTAPTARPSPDATSSRPPSMASPSGASTASSTTSPSTGAPTTSCPRRP